jgi:hypothetical protein
MIYRFGAELKESKQQGPFDKLRAGFRFVQDDKPRAGSQAKEMTSERKMLDSIRLDVSQSVPRIVLAVS